jgi:hypothetical protein
MNFKGHERSGSSGISFYSGNCLEGMTKKDSQFRGRDLNPGLPEYEIGRDYVSLD